MKGVIAIIHPFVDNFHSITSEEYIHSFYDKSFPLSKVSQQIKTISEQQLHSEYNKQLLSLQIPFKCVVESRKTYNRLIGRAYFTVEPQFAALHHEKVDLEALPDHITQCGSTHVEITQVGDNPETSALYKAVREMIN